MSFEYYKLFLSIAVFVKICYNNTIIIFHRKEVFLLYSITAHLDIRCSLEIRERFVRHGFFVYLVDHMTGQMDSIGCSKILPIHLNIGHSSFYCIANLDRYPGPEIHELLQRPEVQRRRIEDL